VLDDDHLVFADIHSPGTIANGVIPEARVSELSGIYLYNCFK
jgi:hypothetical protein